MRKILMICTALLFAFAVCGCGGNDGGSGITIVEPEPDPGTDPGTDPGVDPKNDEYLVGVEYFAGFHEQTTSYNYPDTNQSWIEDFPGRVPNNPEGRFTNAASIYYDIEDAASRGVDFFAILWYPNAQAQAGVEHINEAVDWFMKSENSDRMKFMIEVTNHNPFTVTSVAGWSEIARFCAECMKHPSYLKIDGRPVVKIHGGGAFVADLQGSLTEANAALGAIRNEIIGAGLENPIIAIGLTQNVSVKGSQLRDLAIDISMQYNDTGAYAYDPALLPFDLITGVAETDMMARVDDIVPHVPFVNVGWDGRPWRYETNNPPLPSYKQPTRAEWKSALEMMKDRIDENDNFGFPTKDGGRQKAFTIYAWNEYGEGAYLAPTAESGYMKLEVVNEVFPNNK